MHSVIFFIELIALRHNIKLKCNHELYMTNGKTPHENLML